MSEQPPPRRWAENAQPTAFQLAAWLCETEEPAGWQVEVCERMLEHQDRSTQCFLMNHQAIAEQMDAMRLALAETNDELREQEARVYTIAQDLQGTLHASVGRRIRVALGLPEREVQTRRTILDADAPGRHAAGEDSHPGLWVECPRCNPPEQGAAPHPVAHMTQSGRCSLGSVSHDPHDDCPGVEAGDPAPSTMIGKGNPAIPYEERWECEQPADGIAFRVLEQEWSEDWRTRTIKKVQLLGAALPKDAPWMG